MRIGRWSEHRFIFVCRLVEVTKETDANETSGELGLSLLGNLVGESQLRIPKLEPDTMLFKYVEPEYHDEWWALKSPSIRVSVFIIKLSRYPPVK